MKSPYSPQYAVDVNQDCSNNTTANSHLQTPFYGNQLDNAHYTVADYRSSTVRLQVKNLLPCILLFTHEIREPSQITFAFFCI